MLGIDAEFELAVPVEGIPRAREIVVPLARARSLSRHVCGMRRDLVGHEARAHVRGITRDEIGGYLEHRIRLAGCELPLFEPATVEAIYQASNGLPRKANLLAHHALFAAALAKAKTITTEHIQAALQEVA